MSKVALLNDRVKKLDELAVKIDEEVAAKKKEGYKDAPKYLLDLQKEIADQKAVCEQEKKIIKEALEIKAEMTKPGKTKEELADGKARIKEINTEYKELVKNNASLHGPTAQGVAEPCIPCLLKKAKEQNPAKHFIKFNVVDSSGKPRKRVSFQVELPDGNTKDVKSTGTTIEIPNIEPGNCKIELIWHPGATVHDALIIA